MKLSAVIITFNEEKNIARCINSIKNVADEILVIDSFSNDNTCKIAESLGAKVIQTEWQGYALSKNFGNAQTQHNYILSLDADEALSKELEKSILEVKNNLTGAYQMNRLTNYCGSWIKHCDWYPDTKIRLFDKSKTHWKNLVVHEIIEFSETQTVQQLQGNLLHYSFPTIEEHYQKIEKYSKLEAQKVLNYSTSKIFFKKYFSPIATFIKIFFLKNGWLDGVAGLNIARLSAYASFKRYLEAQKLKSKI